MRVYDDAATGCQVKVFPLQHLVCPVYLNTHPYLETSYLASCRRALQGVQAEMLVVESNDVGVQSEMFIEDTEDDAYIGVQALMKIIDESPAGVQVLMTRSEGIGSQVTMVIYNITQLRILCDFASRGTTALGGTNWTASPAEASGDFSPNNLNTDIVEQRYQSQDGDTALIQLTCDTGIPQGAFVDTIGILNHNLTKAARVTVQASNSAIFAPVSFSTIMVTELENMYWIAPSLPTSSYRYWRFLVEDAFNPDNNIKIGTIVFGSARIFSQAENFELPVSFGKRHFEDSIETEGYTNVGNDRATRKRLGLSFKQLNFNKSNYQLLQEYFAEAKTDLKCLIIPLPERPSALAVFSKLKQLPEDEQHNSLGLDQHYVDLDLEWNEEK
jgi:hypothetical protein